MIDITHPSVEITLIMLDVCMGRSERFYARTAVALTFLRHYTDKNVMLTTMKREREIPLDYTILFKNSH